jgi:hypothetical protein
MRSSAAGAAITFTFTEAATGATPTAAMGAAVRDGGGQCERHGASTAIVPRCVPITGTLSEKEGGYGESAW